MASSHIERWHTLTASVINKAKDPDIVAVSSIMSLKDPISTTRMNLPCRSTVCSHNQCFDALYFLQLQEQAPTWTCPVCNKTISYEALAIDQYVQDILARTSSAVEQVTIEPEGDWHEVKQADEHRGKPQQRAAYDNDSDDDIVEVPDSRVDRLKAEASATPALVQGTPPLSSREQSVSTASVARPPTNGAAKRTNAVIDLTLSDEDEPPRPAKRQNTSQSTSYNTPMSLPDARAADTQNRPQALFGHVSLPRRPDNLPPLPQSLSSSSLTNGQPRVNNWHYGPSHSFSQFQNGNYSHSPP